MAAAYFLRLLLLLFALFVTPEIGSSRLAFAVEDREERFSILNYESLWHDYSPPAPPPSPPDPPSSSCEADLGGTGDFDTLCELHTSVELSSDFFAKANGSFVLYPDVVLSCPVAGCSIAVNLTGEVRIGRNAKIVAGGVRVGAGSMSLADGAAIDTTALAGDPPAQTSGSPAGTNGDGGGHGGRGASCVVKEGQTQEDSWGGDAYSWSTLTVPVSYGSKGGSTSREKDYGGGGGGRVYLVVKDALEVNGSITADGGEGGSLGGGGSGGSIFINAAKMRGTGKISASGGSGLAGGGGGRVSIEVFSWHDDPHVFVHGGKSFGCPENAGAAGTLYDAVPKSLIVSNHNLSTQTDTLLLEFPYQPLWTNVFIRNCAKVAVPLLWSRVQVQGQLSLLCGGILTFGLTHYPYSEFELMAEELLMSDSIIKVFGALRMSVKMLLMWNSKMFINGGRDTLVATSLLEASNLIVLKESSVIHSNANLGVHGQGLLNLSGSGDLIEAQRLILSLFYSIHVGPGSILRGPLINATTDDMAPRLDCEKKDCPLELVHPPEDCNVNSSLSFTLQVCRVEDIDVAGLVQGTVVHFHRARSVFVHPTGKISATGWGCKGGVGRGKILGNGLGGGGGHGGKGGDGRYDEIVVKGGIAYGSAELPCELGSGSGNDTVPTSTAGGGIIVMGSMERSLASLSVHGSVEADGENFREATTGSSDGGPGGGSGGTILLFLHSLTLGCSSVLSSAGGDGSCGGGGGGGGRIHFHWSDIPTGDEYLPVANGKGKINTRGGMSRGAGLPGENGTLTGKTCPEGLYGIFCEECPLGTFKNVTGSDEALCYPCPSNELPHRAVYTNVRGGVAKTPCPYKCVSERYHMPHCYTALEELIYTFGGPWLFGLLLSGLLVLLALVLSVARMKFVGMDELPGPAPTQPGSHIDHSFPFLESLNEVLETNRAEESQSHVHRMYFMGPNTFSEPWHLPHSPPKQIIEIVYEDAYNRFVGEINALAAYQWWEGAIYSILCLLAYPLAWSWQQWRRRKKLQLLREFVRSEYDHACLRSCRSRALYEGLKVAATPDLMLGYLDFFLGGDEKRPDLPPRLHQRFPICLIFGGDGSYAAPFLLHSDNVLTSLMSQAVPPTIWYRLVAGLNAQLRLVRHGHLKVTFIPVLSWLETHANPYLRQHGVCVDLAWFRATALGYCQFGLVVYAVEGETESTIDGGSRTLKMDQSSRVHSPQRVNKPGDTMNREAVLHKRISGGVLDSSSLRMLEEKKKDLFYPFSLIVHNTKPVGHQDLVGLVISILLLADFSLVLLTLLQLYSFSMVDIFLVLFVLPLGILSPFPAGINALFSHGPRRSAGLARVYALWNIASLINVIVAFICGFVHYKSSSRKHQNLQPWNLGVDESGWWLFPAGLVLCKCIQARLVDWHVANLEIQDRSLYSNDPTLFWQS
ncbi:glycine-rich protein [Musa troglodytarum]|uniref:Glycine-rich protein n=1 Tax=Musa troglodytarum TaxID=320322 RepID=A0A9E7F5J7_9LILI|nr:glycine-rich protein [Musa troglodytarum]